MKRVDRYAVEALVLIGLGVLFLLQNLGVLGILAAPIWSLAARNTGLMSASKPLSARSMGVREERVILERNDLCKSGFAQIIHGAAARERHSADTCHLPESPPSSGHRYRA